MSQIVLASGNPGKVKELSTMLSPVGHEILPQSQFEVGDVEETGLTFVENAIIKARHVSDMSGLPAIADDSGLEVDYLGGAPGILSARFAGEHGNDAANNDKLLAELEGVPEALRTARFQCVLVLMRHPADPTPVICQGTWEGIILDAPRGDNGFGYDPLFFVPERQCSSAELSSTDKNSLSHRGQALQQLMVYLQQHPDYLRAFS